MHPRLSMSEMCTYPLPFGDEFALWDELGVRQVGLLTNKVDAFARVARSLHCASARCAPPR